MKTAAGKNREIVFPSSVLPVAERLQAQAVSGLAVFGLQSFYQHFHAYRRRAGLDGITPHCCRHTFATALDEVGTRKLVAKAILGHEVGRDITEVYQMHTTFLQKKEAAEKAAKRIDEMRDANGVANNQNGFCEAP